VLVLRYKNPENRPWKVPLNVTIRGVEIPLGLALITMALFALALVNVLTKKVATISGVSFTIAFFVLFEISEHLNRRRRRLREYRQEMEKFRLDPRDELSPESAGTRPGNVLVAIRNPNRLQHLRRTLERTDTTKLDVVVLSIRLVNPRAGEYPLEMDQIFSEPETALFSAVVTVAEKTGKHVELLLVPGADPIAAIVQTAARLKSSRIVMGLSPKYSPGEQGRLVGEAWEQLPEPRPSLSLEVVTDGRSTYFNLGPHPPRLWPQDVELLHRIWLELSGQGPGQALHHRDLVGLALRRLDQELHSGRAGEIAAQLAGELTAHPPDEH
jgi:nucleotide-binding universal stress UspA family protein